MGEHKKLKMIIAGIIKLLTVIRCRCKCCDSECNQPPPPSPCPCPKIKNETLL